MALFNPTKDERRIISEGTLRPEDLIRAFSNALDDRKDSISLDTERAEHDRKRACCAIDDILASIERKEPADPRGLAVEALAQMVIEIRDVLWPNGDTTFEWSPECLDDIAETLENYDVKPRSPESEQLAVKTLADALEEFAPEGFTFGTHVGDGALFGYWPIKTEEEE